VSEVITDRHKMDEWDVLIGGWMDGKMGE